MLRRWLICKTPSTNSDNLYDCSGLLVLGSLSKGVFERRTATGNETFSLFTRLGATTFVILNVVTRIETIYLKIRAHSMPKDEKRPLPVAVRRSKTPLLKPPIVTLHIPHKHST